MKTTIHNLLLATVAAGSLFTLDTTAHATSFTYDNVTVPSLFVDVIVSGGPPSAPKLIGDGLIILQQGNQETNVPPYKQLLALCIDPLNPNFLTNSGTYNYAPPLPSFTHTQVGEIGALLGYAFDNYKTNDVIAAAAQLDIWRDAYPTVTFTPQNVAVRNEALAIDALDLAPNYAWDSLLDADGIGQTLGTVPVAEPATFAILGTALLLFGVWLRKRDRATRRGAYKILYGGFGP